MLCVLCASAVYMLFVFFYRRGAEAAEIRREEGRPPENHSRETALFEEPTYLGY